MGKCKLVIFDLDNTLHISGQMELLPHIKDILQYLRRSGIRMALASLNVFAREHLQQYNVLHLFDCVESRKTLYDGLYTKDKMFKAIRNKTKIKYRNIVVFDDNFYHCMEAKVLGMKYILVTKDVLSWNDVRRGLCMFDHKQRSKSCHL